MEIREARYFMLSTGRVRGLCVAHLSALPVLHARPGWIARDTKLSHLVIKTGAAKLTLSSTSPHLEGQNCTPDNTLEPWKPEGSLPPRIVLALHLAGKRDQRQTGVELPWLLSSKSGDSPDAGRRQPAPRRW
jgi:hypothetical protein